MCWLKINRPELNISGSISDTSSVASSNKPQSEASKVSDALSEILVYPEPKKKSNSKRKAALNKNAICLTDEEVLEGLVKKEKEKISATEKREARKLKREKKREERERKKKAAQESKKKTAKCSKKTAKNQDERVLRKRGQKEEGLHAELAAINLSEESSEGESDATCPKCGLTYSESDGSLWIYCDGCSSWFDFKYTGLKNKRKIPDLY